MSHSENNRYYVDPDDPQLPSQTDEQWLQFWPPQRQEAGEEDAIHGKWMIFAELPELDQLWPILKEATREGKLGVTMKSSTATSTNGNGLICVYNKDDEDIEDIRRVLRALRELGISQPLTYKSDQQTLQGVRGSLWYSRSGDEMKPTGKKGR